MGIGLQKYIGHFHGMLSCEVLASLVVAGGRFRRCTEKRLEGGADCMYYRVRATFPVERNAGIGNGGGYLDI